MGFDANSERLADQTKTTRATNCQVDQIDWTCWSTLKQCISKEQTVVTLFSIWKQAIRVTRTRRKCHDFGSQESCHRHHQWSQVIGIHALHEHAFSHHVSWLLNFFVTTLPSSMPSRSAIFWARSWCELPLKTLMFGILRPFWLSASSPIVGLASSSFSSHTTAAMHETRNGMRMSKSQNLFSVKELTWYFEWAN